MKKLFNIFILFFSSALLATDRTPGFSPEEDRNLHLVVITPDFNGKLSFKSVNESKTFKLANAGNETARLVRASGAEFLNVSCLEKIVPGEACIVHLSMKEQKLNQSVFLEFQSLDSTLSETVGLTLEI